MQCSSTSNQAPLASSEQYKFTNKPFEIQVVDKLGQDLTIVNAARISFQTLHDTLTPGDVKLCEYLAAEKHFSPFRHVSLQFRIKAPEFVMRQLFKHVVGIEATSVHPTKDAPWNEMSGRYKVYKEIYIPSVFYQQHPTAKQCSAGEHENSENMKQIFETGVKHALNAYNQLILNGVSREQARIMLPLGIMTEVVWTASLQAILNFVQLRDSAHAQLEIRELAQAMKELTIKEFPVTFKTLMEAEYSPKNIKNFIRQVQDKYQKGLPNDLDEESLSLIYQISKINLEKSSI